MTGEEFKTVRTNAGLSLRELGELLRVSDLRSLQRWEDGTKEVSGPVSVLMKLLRDGVWPVA
ncbi:hypothetical protein [Sphingomonas glacialis]|uniref:XRE family transcriptional regulator n=1 Tax=Sphingomonas glacialis TaxID=658225 RepID=A0A502FS04_9SPHN|nr:hypothetical protein [Sphingomonas glacialis]TPG52179.1 hypothetical protein EAH76_15885 [Sphingomonas glacialis]